MPLIGFVQVNDNIQITIEAPSSWKSEYDNAYITWKKMPKPMRDFGV